MPDESPTKRVSLPARALAECPSCKKAVDPLRAGHVAVFDGVFVYFCDRGCKEAYVGALDANPFRDDVPTLAPPPVREPAVVVVPVSTRVPAIAVAAEGATSTEPDVVAPRRTPVPPSARVTPVPPTFRVTPVPPAPPTSGAPRPLPSVPSFAIALPSLPLTVTVVTATATVAIGAVLALESRFSFVAALVASAALAAAVVWLVEHARRLHEREAHATLANKGVTFRDRAAWDAARRTTRVAFAFRGSLVTPEPDLLATESASGASEATLLARVAAALDVARHPFAAPARRAMAPRVPDVVACTSAETTVDHGVVATFVTGETLAIGPRAFLVGRGVGVSAIDARATSFEEAGRIVFVVAENGTVVGLVVFADALRGGARGAVQRLLDARIEPVLLSHDPVEPATVLARALDVDHVRAAIPADGEGAAVRALDDTGHATAVIADPTVATAALLASSLPIALGGDVTTFAAATQRTDPRDAVDVVLVPKAANAKARRDAFVFAAVPVASVFATALGILPLRYVPLSVFVSLAVFVATIRRGPRGSVGADDAVMSRAPRL